MVQRLNINRKSLGEANGLGSFLSIVVPMVFYLLCQRCFRCCKVGKEMASEITPVGQYYDRVSRNVRCDSECYVCEPVKKLEAFLSQNARQNDQLRREKRGFQTIDVVGAPCITNGVTNAGQAQNLDLMKLEIVVLDKVNALFCTNLASVLPHTPLSIPARGYKTGYIIALENVPFSEHGQWLARFARSPSLGTIQSRL